MEMKRWKYRETLNATAVHVSHPMNLMAAQKAFGPLLIGPAGQFEYADEHAGPGKRCGHPACAPYERCLLVTTRNQPGERS